MANGSAIFSLTDSGIDDTNGGTENGDGGKLYGLDPARKIVTVSTMNGQQRKVLLGRVDDNKRVYAKLEGKKEVVLLSEADTSKINRDRGGFLVAEKKEPEPKKEEPKKGSEPKK